MEEVFQGYYSTKSSFIRVKEIFDLPVEHGIRNRRMISGASFDEIRVEGVSFAYKGGRIIISDSSAIFERGWNHIQGKNGSGKSTLVNLLTKILAPMKGKHPSRR